MRPEPWWLSRGLAEGPHGRGHKPTPAGSGPDLGNRKATPVPRTSPHPWAGTTGPLGMSDRRSFLPDLPWFSPLGARRQACAPRCSARPEAASRPGGRGACWRSVPGPRSPGAQSLSRGFQNEVGPRSQRGHCGESWALVTAKGRQLTSLILLGPEEHSRRWAAVFLAA